MNKNSYRYWVITLTVSLSNYLIACDDTGEEGGDPIVIGGTESGTELTGGTTAGMTAAGTNTAGTNTAGTNTAGTNTAGTNTAGTNTAGTNTAGTNTAGTNTAGTMTGGSMTGGAMTGGVDMTPPDCSTATVEAPCQVSIYSARQVNLVPDLMPVEVEGVVTALRINDDGEASHVVLQDPAGGPWSGVWVYLNDADVDALPIFTRGETVRLSGQVADYFGQRQINTVTSISQLGVGAVVNPQPVDPMSVATNGIDSVAMEGVLVTLSQVAVEEVDPVAGPGDMNPNNEFVVSGGLRVDDYLYPFTLPIVGDQFTSITGVLRLGNGDFKLIPRSAEDLLR